MEITNLTFLQYTLLPEDYRLQYQEVYIAQEPVQIDCQSWTWGAVKKAQDTLNSELTFQDVFDLAKQGAETPLTANSPAHLVYKLFLGVKKAIDEITRIESQSWATQLTPKQMQAINEVGGFEAFGTMPQTIRLTEILKMSYTEILNIPWELGFAAYSYDVKSSLYNQLIVKQR